MNRLLFCMVAAGALFLSGCSKDLPTLPGSSTGSGVQTSAQPGHPTPDATNPGVLPANSKPYGKSYAEWSALWWQWAYGLPATGHPLFDEVGDLLTDA